jgi:hypothetical protein
MNNSGVKYVLITLIILVIAAIIGWNFYSSGF